MKNAISWFEIPVSNLSRAQTFYEVVLACSFRREAMGPSEGAVFPYDEAAGGVGGALLCGPTAPTVAQGSGVLIYLDCGNSRVDTVLERVLGAGGTIAMPRTPLPPGLGYIAALFDLDGNKIGIHAMQ